MKQDQYWMLMKRRQFLKSSFKVCKNSIHEDSWQEKAFAEDGSGHLGGYAWPPRSYSCSFCKREFRSAQALGGHMNVHRRDRARLKQSLSTSATSHQSHYVFQYRDHSQTDHLKSFGPLFPSRFSTVGYDLDPSCDSSTVASTTDLTSSRALSSPQENNTSDQTFVSSIIQEKLDAPSSRVEMKAREEEFAWLDNDDKVETNLFMGCNSLLGRNRPTGFYGDISRKRPKTAVPAVSFVIKPCSSDRCGLQHDDFETKSKLIEDIDLELRLGEPTKVK